MCFNERGSCPFAIAMALTLCGCATVSPTPEQEALIKERAVADETLVREAFEAEQAAETAARNGEVEAKLQSRLHEGTALAQKQASLQSEMLELIELYQTADSTERMGLEARFRTLADEARAMSR